MDPNTAYENWCLAVTDNDRYGAVEAAEALMGWLERGGFEPEGWTEEQRSTFAAWCDEHVRGNDG
jgi:hypothetical protein